jgi:hypothetical protein
MYFFADEKDLSPEQLKCFQDIGAIVDALNQELDRAHKLGCVTGISIQTSMRSGMTADKAELYRFVKKPS